MLSRSCNKHAVCVLGFFLFLPTDKKIKVFCYSENEIISKTEIVHFYHNLSYYIKCNLFSIAHLRYVKEFNEEYVKFSKISNID